MEERVTHSLIMNFRASDWRWEVRYAREYMWSHLRHNVVENLVRFFGKINSVLCLMFLFPWHENGGDIFPQVCA